MQMKSLVDLIPQSVRTAGRRIILAGTPSRHRLAAEIRIERLMGRLEEELLMLGSLTPSRGTAVDVGANRGHYSYVMSRIFSHVVAFEPNEKVITELVRCGAPNITVHCCAISSGAGTRDLYVPLAEGQDLSGWASLDHEHVPGWRDFGVVKAEVRRLDDFDLKDVSLLKIDVEGHELAVLEGGARTIRASRPVVILESEPGSRAQVARFFEELDFEPYVAKDGRLQLLPEGLERYSGPKYTFIFKPKISP